MAPIASLHETGRVSGLGACRRCTTVPRKNKAHHFPSLQYLLLNMILHLFWFSLNCTILSRNCTTTHDVVKESFGTCTSLIHQFTLRESRRCRRRWWPKSHRTVSFNDSFSQLNWLWIPLSSVRSRLSRPPKSDPIHDQAHDIIICLAKVNQRTK